MGTLSILLLAALGANDKPTVSLRPTAVVSSSIVRLRDVADILASGPNAAQAGALDLEEIRFAGSVKITKSLVIARLAIAGWHPRVVDVKGSDICVVRLKSSPGVAAVQPAAFSNAMEFDSNAPAAHSASASPQFLAAISDVREFEEASIRGRLVHLLQNRHAEKMSREPKDVRIRLLSTIVAPDADDACQMHVEIGQDFSGSSDSSDLLGGAKLGTRRCAVTMLSASGKKRRQNVMYSLAARVNVPSLNREVLRGQLLTAADIDWEPQFITDKSRMLTLQQIVGKTVGSSQAARTKVQGALLVDPAKVKLVAASQRVNCTVRVGALSVIMSNAIALESGARGETIRVRNPSSDAVLKAVVVNDKQVEALP